MKVLKALLLAVLVMFILRGGFLVCAVDGPRLATWIQASEVNHIHTDEGSAAEWLTTVTVTEEQVSAHNTRELIEFALKHLSSLSGEIRVVFVTQARDTDHISMYVGTDDTAVQLTLSDIDHVHEDDSRYLRLISKK